MDDINSLLEKKAAQLNAEQTLDELSVIADEIQRMVPDAKFSVPKIYPGRKALVVACDINSASEIRFLQITIIRSLQNILKQPLKNLVVIVR